MSKFFYHLRFEIKPELTPQFEKYFGLVMQAHLKYSSLADKMQFSRTFLGGKDIIILTIPMESLGEIEAFGHTPMVVLGHYGQEKGLEIIEQYCKAMHSWESSITRPYEIA